MNGFNDRGENIPAGQASAGGRNNNRIAFIAAGIGALILILIPIVAYLLFFRVDPHYTLGVKHLQAKNYEEAEAEFRLCLENRPDDAKTKGLLAYSVLRAELADMEMKPERLSEECLMKFLLYYTHLESEDMVKDIKSKTTREWTSDRVKDAQKNLRGLFKEKHIPFRDWIEFRQGILGTAQVVFSLPVDSDDEIDCVFKDIAAAVLSRDSQDTKAIKHLMARCANDSVLLNLMLVAGEKSQGVLEKEVDRKGSFIESDGQFALRGLKLVTEIRNFVHEHPKLRVMRKSDLPDRDGLVYNDCLNFKSQWFYEYDGPVAYYAFNGVGNQIVLMEALKGCKFDPMAINISEDKVDDDCYLATIGGYDAELNKYVCRAIMWDTNKWNRMTWSDLPGSTKQEELIRPLPAGLDLTISPNGKQAAIAVRCCGQAERVNYEDRERPVTRYRQEYQYNPQYRWDDYNECWEGGYEWVDVPYEDTEVYTAEVEYKEQAVGNRWLICKLDSKRKRLWFEKDEWMESGSPFGK